MGRRPINLNLSAEDIDKIYYVINDIDMHKDYIRRCLILLMSYQGVALKTIATNLNISKTTANRWRQSFMKYRWKGIDIKKSGRPKKLIKPINFKRYHTIKNSKVVPVHEIKKDDVI